VPTDREAIVRQAERLKGQGKVDLAIAEYVRLVEEQPRDWNAINALGDLYLTAGDADRAVAQFVRIADDQFGEGFLPKAAALYKKALKTRPDHEHTLGRLAEIAAAQELLADARAYLRRLWELRSGRGDDAGSAECLVRLGELPEADAETLLTGARAAKILGEHSRAGVLFRAAAEELQKAGRAAAALEALSQVALLEPGDLELRRLLTSQYVAAGQLEDAGRLLDPETAGEDPELLLALASMQAARRDEESVRSTLTRLISLATDRSDDVLRIAGEAVRAGEPGFAFTCIEVVVDDAVLRGEWDRAIGVLQSFLVHASYVPALLKLEQVATEAGHDDVLQEAREKLADAYLEAGRGAEAQLVCKALLADAPASPVHAARLRRALELAGVDDPDDVMHGIQQLAAATSGEEAKPDDVDEEVVVLQVQPNPDPDPDSDSEPDSESDSESDFDPDPDPPDALMVHLSDMAQATQPGEEGAEIDLSAAIKSLGPPAALTSSLPAAADAAVLFERGQRRLNSGQIQEGLADLEAAARVPSFRFQAAWRVGREHAALGTSHSAIEWLEKAADAAPSRDESLSVMYELGIALQRAGESARALAVFIEVDAEDPAYRDVASRLAVLARVAGEPRR
jgi:tetratricopeptide (TPR) repeat protein